MAEKNYSVIAPLVIARTAEGDLYLYQGVPVPSTVGDDEIKRLVKGEFIAADKAPEPSQSTPVEIPAGDPTAEWTVKQLTAFAKDKGIDLGDARNKDDIFAVVAPK